jgi:hypothetical protein
MTAGLLEASSDEEDRDIAARSRGFATGVGEGIELTRRLAPEQLDIPLNEPFGKRLALVREDTQQLQLGSVALTLIGPFPEDVDKLRDEWKDWMDTNKQALADLRERMQRDSDKLATDFDRLKAALAFGTTALGKRSEVTVPNLASIMFLAEEGDRKVLLTGDGHWQDILKGLERANRIAPEGSLHVDVLKVQHHGSEHNFHEDFARRVIADHYVFCADGLHENPDEAVVKAIVASRLGGPEVKSTHPKVDDPFELHFNSSPDVITNTGLAHMRLIQQVATQAAADSNGKLTCRFLTASSFVLDLA